MLELEVLQLTQKSRELEALCPDPEGGLDRMSAPDRQRFIEALVEAPGASTTLRQSLGAHMRRSRGVADRSGADAGRPMAPGAAQAGDEPRRCPRSSARRLRVFAFDPLLGTRLDTLGINQTTLEVRWEKDLGPGPVGEYLEVVDVDPASGAATRPST